jgi:predicted hotdog family 3-hydroxylacyl-ACP dehydratase
MMKTKSRDRRMVNIEDLIPHREPIRIISEVIEISDDSAITGAVVKSSWPLFDGDAVNSLVLIEAIAQTAALVEGYKRTKEGKGGVKGWLVGIKSADFKQSNIPLNTRIVVSVKSLYSFDNYGVIEGKVKCGNDLLAVAVLQALRMDDDTLKIF